MRLYHGTSSRHLRSILKSGLRPRADRRSNWQAASSGKRVYLTNAYAMYFAQFSRKKDTEDLLIVEIDTELLAEPSRLQADEDSAWFFWRAGSLPRDLNPPLGMEDKYDQATHFSEHLEILSKYWLGYQKSLELLETCSYEGVIPTSAISRVLRYSVADGAWWVSFHDPVISPGNFRFNGSEYRASQLVVAGRLEEARQVEQLVPGFLDLDAIEEMCAPRREVVLNV